MSSIHIESDVGDIYPRVIMTVDPNNTHYIATKFLENARVVNKQNGNLAYTGKYKDNYVTIFSSGMGIASMGVYSYELFNDYDVDRIILIGTSKSYLEELKTNDIFLVDSAYSLTSFDTESGKEDLEIINSSTELNGIITSTALLQEMKLSVGRVHTTDAYYTNEESFSRYTTIGCKAVDMETYSLLYNAKKFMKKATSLLVINDNLVNHEIIDNESKVKKLDEMIVLALESIIKN